MNPEITSMLADANAAYTGRDWQRAQNIAERILEIEPQHYWAVFMVGNVCDQLGDKAGAIRAWRDAVRTPAPARLGAYFQLVKHQFKEQDFSESQLVDEALALSEVSLQRQWYHARLLFLSGVRHIAANELPQADNAIAAAHQVSADFDAAELVWDWTRGLLQQADLSSFPALDAVLRDAMARDKAIADAAMRSAQRESASQAEADGDIFGEPCPLYPITDPQRYAPFERTVTTLPDAVLPESTTYGPEDLPNFLNACTASFRVGYTDAIRGTVFLPDHAVYVNTVGGSGLIEESLWHSRLFRSEWFKSDRTTKWQWRVDPGWQVTETVDDLVNYCYHRMEFQYFHWFFDTLPRVWAFKNHPPGDAQAKWYVGALKSQFQIPSLALFDVSAQDCIQPQTPIVQFDHMRCPGFLFAEPLHTRPMFNSGIHHKGWSPEYVMTLRDRAWARYNCKPRPGNLMLYVSRGDAAHRRLLNDAAVRSLLQSHGFTVVEPSTLSFEAQVQLFAKARVIVGVHGAGLTNIVWSPPGAQVLELLPDKILDPGYRFLSNFCGHHHHAILCPTADHALGPAFGDVEVSVDALKRALSAILGTTLPRRRGTIAGIADLAKYAKQLLTGARR
jgi:hypothetical protein